MIAPEKSRASGDQVPVEILLVNLSITSNVMLYLLSKKILKKMILEDEITGLNKKDIPKPSMW